MATVVRSLTRTSAAASRLSPSARPASRIVTRQPLRFQPRRGFAEGGPEPKPSSTPPPPPPPPKGGNSGLFWGLGIAAAAGAGYYGYTQYMGEDVVAEIVHGAQEFSSTHTAEDYQKVYDAIAERLVEEDDYDDGSYGPVVLRLGWHASGTYDAETKTGGSNGATMRFMPESDHSANSGLMAARNFLEPIKKQFPWITYSDLWTLASVVAIQEMQGPSVPWRPGRSDREAAWCTPDGRLPDGGKGASHLRAIFGRMGFSDQEIVALSGAHALGRCHVDRSGFDGPWTFSPITMTNDYYKLLLDEKWHVREWTGPQQYQDKTTKSLMMLPTDMELIKDRSFRPTVEKYAKDNDKFFSDFSNVMCKLLELGVPFKTGEDARMIFKATS